MEYKKVKFYKEIYEPIQYVVIVARYKDSLSFVSIRIEKLMSFLEGM